MVIFCIRENNVLDFLGGPAFYFNVIDLPSATTDELKRTRYYKLLGV